MATSTKRVRPRAKKKKFSRTNIVRKIVLYFLMAVMVGVTVFTAGYVIFFRTVFAQEILPALKNEIVFEEPNPPVHVEESVDLAQTDKSEKEDSRDKAQIQASLPRVAIIIDDLGYHRQIGEDFLNFPFELTYSFLPFAPYTGKQEQIAYDSGKTVLLHLPMEPKGEHWNPGPGTLYLSDSPELQLEKLEQDLAEVPHATGVNNHMGSLYTSNIETMRPLIKQLGQKGLFFVDSFTASESVGYRVAQELGVKSLRRHIFLDNVIDEFEVCKQLEKLVKIAEQKGWGIGIGHPHKKTLVALDECVLRYENRVSFVSITKIFDTGERGNVTSNEY